MSIGLWVVYRGIVKLDSQISAPVLYFLGGEIGSIVRYYAMGDTVTVNHAGYKIDDRPDLAEVTGFASIHLVNLSTMTSRYFFFLVPPLSGLTMSSP